MGKVFGLAWDALAERIGGTDVECALEYAAKLPFVAGVLPVPLEETTYRCASFRWRDPTARGSNGRQADLTHPDPRMRGVGPGESRAVTTPPSDAALDIQVQSLIPVKVLP